MVTPIPDGSVTVDMPAGSPLTWRPQDFDGQHPGTLELQSAFRNMLNVPAVEVGMTVGVTQVVMTARAMGAPPFYGLQDSSGKISDTTVVSPDQFNPSVMLGGDGQTPLQMATAMSTLAAAGTMRRPEAVLRGASGTQTE